MKLLLDEMYPASVAIQLRALGHDVASVHDPDFRYLEGAPDQDVFAAAVVQQRSVVTENVPDFRLLEGEALARGERTPGLIFTTYRQFPRGHAATVGRLTRALAVLLAGRATLSDVIFLKSPSS